MSPLYRRTLLTALLTSIGLFVVVLIAANLILVRSYEEVERRDVENNTQRAVNALSDQVAALNQIALGWSKWDDTRQFIADQNETFQQVNLVPGTFIGTGFEQSIWLNTDDEIVFRKAVDHATAAEIPVPDDLLVQVQPGKPLITHPDETSEITGLVRLESGLMIISSLPVLNSEGVGPINGTQVWGQYVQADEIERLAETTRLGVEIRELDDPNLPADYAEAKEEFEWEKELVTYVLPQSENNIAGFTILKDLYGAPIAIMRAEMPRPIYQQGQSTIRYFLLAIMLVGLVFTVINLTSLERNVLRRVASLSKSVDIIRETDQMKTPILISGSDEITNLGRGMRSMLDQVAEGRQRLSRYNQELEQRVAERTRELSETNTKLIREVAERNQAQLEAAQARDQALEALRFRTQILANVSHDARTPLTAISLQTELLQKGMLGEVTPKQQETLGRMLHSSRQLLSFINNMLSEAQLNAGRLTMSYARISPETLTEQAVTMMQPIAERKGLALNLSIDPSTPHEVTADPERLKQVLNNLIDNAIKFTSTGSIMVSTRRHLSENDPSKWVITVADTGQGIPKENIDRIFDPFYQIDGSMTRDANRGVGLGLSIVKQTIEAMGGTLVVESITNDAPNRGTTFTITLPTEPLSTVQTEPTPDHQQPLPVEPYQKDHVSS